MSVIVVTGATSGIGESTAAVLADRGHTVIVTGRRDDEVSRVVAEILDRGQGRAVVGLCMDVTDLAGVQTAVDAILRNHGSIAGWVNNAGTSEMAPFLEVSHEQLMRTFEINTIATFQCSQVVGRVMKQQGSGQIVNIASMAGKAGGVRFLSDYVASKAAVIGLTQAMATELGQYSVRVNSVCPGFVDTPMQERELSWESVLDNRGASHIVKDHVASTPLGRLSIPEDTAKAVAFLVSEESQFITGESLAVNGGAFMD